MKKIFVLVVLALTLSLSACSFDNYIEVGSVEINKPNEKKMNYSLLTGTKDYRVTFNSTTRIDIEIETEKGEFDLKIVPDSGDKNNSYNGSNLESCHFSVIVDEGTYTIIVSAKKHKGGYDIKW